MNLVFLPFGYWVAILKFSQIRIKKNTESEYWSLGLEGRELVLVYANLLFIPHLNC